ncbi:MAG: hypothetical protein M1814_004480 [Vezdaea aestivalis]|nr:MAG: hypothetical protein M1814_004480 [Vezdaea aestivalis]
MRPFLISSIFFSAGLAISPYEVDPSEDQKYTAFTIPVFTSAQVPPTPSSAFLPFNLQLNILRRQTFAASASVSASASCPASYLPCSGSGIGACCRQGTVCSNDAANHVACCPTSAVCTGTINVGTQTGSAGSATSSTSSVTAAGTGSSSSGFIVPAGVTSATQAVAGSTVSNQYYAFVALPTSFSNAAACSSGFSSCATEYQKCTNALGGNANALTVGGANGAGITVGGATVSLGPSATQVCGSLSQEACRGLQLASCTAYGGASGLSSPNAAPTKAPGLGIGAMGVMVGLVGQVL